MIDTILLTGTININNCTHLERSDISTRTIDYYLAIKWWLDNTTLKVVFVENSENTLEFLNSIKNDRLELISFNNNDYDRNYGKGYGERLSILYALENSTFLKDCTQFMKMNGRLIITNFDIIQNVINNLGNIDILIMLMNNNRTVRSEFFIISVHLFNDYFLKKDIDDSKGLYFEVALANVINEVGNKYDVKFLRYENVEMKGYSGTYNTKY